MKAEDQELTMLQAFEVMQNFLEKYYEQTLSEDIGTLLGELQILSDGKPADPAAWNNWMQSISQVINKNNELLH